MGFLGKAWNWGKNAVNDTVHGVAQGIGKGMHKIGLGKAADWMEANRGDIFKGMDYAGAGLAAAGAGLAVVQPELAGVGGMMGKLGGALGTAASLGQNFFGQSHKPASFKSVSDPSYSLDHLPFEGKIASQALSDNITNRKHPLDTINSSLDINDRISGINNKRTIGDMTIPGGGIVAPPLYTNKRIRSMLPSGSSIARPVSEINMNNYNSAPSIYPRMNTGQYSEQLGRGAIR